MAKLDWSVIGTAVLSGLVVVVPAAVVSQLFVSEESTSALAYVFLIVIMFGFATCGYAAARLKSTTPMMHGAVAALLTYVIVQGVGIVTSIIRGNDINPIGYPLLAGLAASCGLLGALFGDWYRRRLTYR